MHKSTEAAADAYAWHVSSVLAFPVTPARLMAHHVQRYRRPEEPGRETGEILSQTFATEAHARALPSRS